MHNIRYLCHLVATVQHTAKKAAARRAEAAEVPQQHEGDRIRSVLPSTTLDNNMGNNSFCTSIDTELRERVISYRSSTFYRAKYGTYLSGVCAVNFCYSNNIVLQELSHSFNYSIIITINSSFAEDSSGLHRLHH